MNTNVMLETIKGYDLVSEKLNKNIKGLKAHPKILDKQEHKRLYPAYERAMYVALSLLDLNTSLKYLDISNALSNSHEANYFSRNVALISYELLNHQQKIVGKDVAALVVQVLGEEGLSGIKSHSRKLKSVTKKNSKRLGYIRNNLLGHRTENGSEMVIGMLGIDDSEIYKIGKDIFDIYLELYGAYIELLERL